jgi:tetratricopeptide (TPR) repeat protein
MAERDVTIIGDFLRYSGLLFVVFFAIGLVLCLIKGFSPMALLVNPLIYSIGIGLIIIVFTHDINSILGLVGLGKEQQLSPHIKYHNEIQEIGMLMGMANYAAAMKKVDILLHLAPEFARAHTLRGEILLTGFEKKRQARESFDRAMALSQPEDEEYQLAVSLKASTFG